MSKEKTYLVVNEGTSPVAVATRFDSFMIAGKNSLPLSMDEIHQINVNSNAFKIGLLFFEPEYEEEIYDYLRIRNWKEILHNDDIQQMLEHPTAESMTRILSIEDPYYFERIRGVYTMMKNTGISFSSNVDKIIKARRKEFIERKYHTSISVNEVKDPVKKSVPAEEFEAYKEAMEKKMAELMSMMSASSDAKATTAAAREAAPQVVEPAEVDPVVEETKEVILEETPAQEEPKKTSAKAKKTKSK